MKSLCIPVFLMCLFAVDLSAQEINKQQVKQLILQANQGDPEAQVYLGDMFRRGKGVPIDNTMARKWYNKAADQDDAKGQFSLGIMYYRGLGVTQDYAKAIEWYHKSAEQGYADAQMWLGYIYYLGPKAYRNLDKAKTWYSTAADQGHEEAELYLKKMSMTPREDGSTRAAPWAELIIYLLIIFPFWWLIAGYYLNCSAKRLGIMFIIICTGGFIGFFIAFACNGGAAGSSELTDFALSCLSAYLLFFYMLLAIITYRGKQKKNPAVQ